MKKKTRNVLILLAVLSAAGALARGAGLHEQRKQAQQAYNYDACLAYIEEHYDFSADAYDSNDDNGLLYNDMLDEGINVEADNHLQFCIDIVKGGN